MSTNYLKSKWKDITREERFFCSHLYHSILGSEKEFVNWLKTESILTLNVENDWEISFEVCFYRDLIKQYESLKPFINKNKYSLKRTFDLCLFSNDHIVIIEAKAQQGFSINQIREINSDKVSIINLFRELGLDVNINVSIILLHSSRYRPRNKKILNYPRITWEQLSKSKFNQSDYFQLADKLYRH